MKVIVVGAGGVGYVAAETLSVAHDVLVIENDESIADTVMNRLDVSVLHEDGTNPRILKFAIMNHKADIIISTMGRDDSNVYVCMIAKHIKPSIITVASVTNPDFHLKKDLITADQEDVIEVDSLDIIISPELITAEKMYRLCILENAVDYEMFNQFDIAMAIFEVNSDSELIGKVAMNTVDIKDATIFAIYRNEELYFQTDSMEIHSGDKLCVMGSNEAITKFNDDLGVEITNRDIVILGGTIVGKHLAMKLSTDEKKRYVRIIERNQNVSKDLSKAMKGVVVVNGDFTEPDIQNSENIFKADCLVTVTNQDDTNLLMCMSGQKHNTNKIISRYIKKEYMDIFMFTGLDTIVGSDRIVANEVSKSVMSDDKVIMRMRNRDEQFFIHDVGVKSKLLDKYYGDILLPNGLRIIAIRRDGQTIFPAMDTMFKDGDRVFAFTNFTKDKDLARVFGRNVMSES